MRHSGLAEQLSETAMPRETKGAATGPRWETIVGDNVRRLRKHKGLTQAQLASASGLDLRYLGGIERGAGNPSVDVLGRLAGALDVHPGELLYEFV
ncbi:HTH-type transcriptional regulator SinR [compost metagenome]